jgi:hypothetical protein
MIRRKTMSKKTIIVLFAFLTAGNAFGQQLGTPTPLQRILNELPAIPIAGRNLKFEFGGGTWIARLNGENVMAGTVETVDISGGSILALKQTHIWGGGAGRAVAGRVGGALGGAIGSVASIWIATPGPEITLDYRAGPRATLSMASEARIAEARTATSLTSSQSALSATTAAPSTTSTLAQTSVNSDISGYFVGINGQQTGPHNASGLMQLVEQGQLTKNSLVWKEGMTNWVAAGTVDELSPLFPATPPPLPVSQSPPPLPDYVPQAAASPDEVQTSNRKWYNSFASGLENNRVFINVGVGYGPTGGIDMGIPPLSASVDIKISNKVPLSIGPTWIFSTWEYSSPYYDYTYWNFGIGIRAMYHLNLVKNLDIYAGPVLGYAVRLFGEDLDYELGYVLFGGYTGIRFFFTRVIGVYAEAGYNRLQYVNAGLSLKI